MHFSHRRENEVSKVSKMTTLVGSLWWHIVSTSLALHIAYNVHVDCHLLRVDHSLLTHFYCHHAMCRAIECKYSLNCIGMTSVQFHMLHVTFHESDLRCEVIHRHCSATNVGHAGEHNYKGLAHTHPITKEKQHLSHYHTLHKFWC